MGDGIQMGQDEVLLGGGQLKTCPETQQPLDTRTQTQMSSTHCWRRQIGRKRRGYRGWMTQPKLWFWWGITWMMPEVSTEYSH